MADYWTIEFQEPNGEWRIAMPRKKWKTEKGAYLASEKWGSLQARDGWHPIIRVTPLFVKTNDLGALYTVFA